MIYLKAIVFLLFTCAVAGNSDEYPAAIRGLMELHKRHIDFYAQFADNDQLIARSTPPMPPMPPPGEFPPFPPGGFPPGTPMPPPGSFPPGTPMPPPGSFPPGTPMPPGEFPPGTPMPPGEFPPGTPMPPASGSYPGGSYSESGGDNCPKLECTWANLQKYRKDFQDVYNVVAAPNYILNISDPIFEKLACALPGYAECAIEMTKSLITVVNGTRIQSTTDCPDNYRRLNSTAADRDPCCTYEVSPGQDWKCCAKRDVRYPARIFEGVNSATVTAKCKTNADEITQILKVNYLSLLDQDSITGVCIDTEAFMATIGKVSDIAQTCFTNAFSPPACTSNSDCEVPGATCESKQCRFDFGKANEWIPQCIGTKLSNSDPQLLAVLKAYLKLKQSDNVRDALIAYLSSGQCYNGYNSIAKYDTQQKCTAALACDYEGYTLDELTASKCNALGKQCRSCGNYGSFKFCYDSPYDSFSCGTNRTMCIVNLTSVAVSSKAECEALKGCDTPCNQTTYTACATKQQCEALHYCTDGGQSGCLVLQASQGNSHGGGGGYINCPDGSYQRGNGCFYYSSTKAECDAKKGIYSPAATDEVSCEHRELGGYCQQGRDTPQSQYQWRSGVWQSGSYSETYAVTPAMVTGKFEWRQSVDFNKLSDLMMAMIGPQIQGIYARAIKCLLNTMMYVGDNVACKCDVGISGTPTTCPTLTLDAEVPVAATTAYTGTSYKVTAPATSVNPDVTIGWDGETIKAEADSCPVSAAGVNQQASAAKTGRRAQSDRVSVVASPSSSTVVGQLTSVAARVEFDATKLSSTNAGIQVCIMEDSALSVDTTATPTRTQAAVAFAGSASGPYYPISGGAVDSSTGRTCIYTKKPGYFAACRVDAGTTTVKPSALPNLAPPASTGSTPTPTGTPSPTGNTPQTASSATQAMVSFVALIAMVLLACF